MKKLFISGLILLGSIQSGYSQVWKHDINFQNVAIGNESHIFKGVIDNNDRTYLLQRVNKGFGNSIIVREYLPDGTNGFEIPILAAGTQVEMMLGHNGGGIAADENYVYVAREYHSTNAQISHFIQLLAVDRANPMIGLEVARISGEFYVSDIAVHNGLLHVYGSTEEDIQIDPYGMNIQIQNSGTKESVLMQIDVSNVTANNQAGTINWVKKITYNAWVDTGNVALDENGDIYISGMAHNNAVIGNGAGFPSQTIIFPTAASAGYVARFSSNGMFDPSFEPIVIDNHQNNGNSTMHSDNIEDIRLDPQSDHLYLVVRNLIRKYSTTGAGSPQLVWSTIDTDMISSNRLAISNCNEMYITGLRDFGTATLPDFHYYTKSLNKQTGAFTTTMISNDGTSPRSSQGEVILIQSDGDKVVAGDYFSSAGLFYVDYDQSTIPVSYPSITYNDPAYYGSFLGIYDDGVRGNLTNQFVLTDINGVEKLTFGCWENILINGSASTNETNHFIDLWKYNGSSYQWHGSFGWLGGEAGVHNISQMAASSGISLLPGTYQIKMAVQNNCVGWMEKIVQFTITTETLAPGFDMQLSDMGTTINVSCQSNVNPPHAEHLWYTYNVTTGSIVHMSNWSAGASTYSRTGLSKQVTYNIVHVVRDPKGCAVQANTYVQIYAMKKSALATIDPESLNTLLERTETENAEAVAAVSNDDLILESISLFPNPTNGPLTLVNNGDATTDVSVYTSTGQFVFSESVSGKSCKHLFINDLSKGVYLITITSPDGFKTTHRVVKE